ncbi:MAG: TetR/AcrR family transcriptional regulator [Actinomycetaceae bacterium]|nr:TetR/AcrR family transcriptional regulator [Actinomycetaceae bacterium]
MTQHTEKNSARNTSEPKQNSVDASGAGDAGARGESAAERTLRRRLDPDQRREAIFEAARAEFATTPYSQVKIGDIAAASGSSPALIYRYFAGKDGLYAEVMRVGYERLAVQQESALAALPPNTSVRDHVRTIVQTYLDFVAENRESWGMVIRQSGAEPASVGEIRDLAREARIAQLRGVLASSENRRHEMAICGFYGFVDAVLGDWVASGCPDDDRAPLIETALGALQGALGDWAA